jgi:hypothetical protein
MAEVERFMNFIPTSSFWRVPRSDGPAGANAAASLSVADPTLLGVMMNVA